MDATNPGSFATTTFTLSNYHVFRATSAQSSASPSRDVARSVMEQGTSQTTGTMLYTCYQTIYLQSEGMRGAEDRSREDGEGEREGGDGYQKTAAEHATRLILVQKVSGPKVAKVDEWRRLSGQTDTGVERKPPVGPVAFSPGRGRNAGSNKRMRQCVYYKYERTGQVIVGGGIE